MDKYDNLGHSEEGPSNRSFGLTVGGILLFIQAFRYWLEPLWDTLGIILAGIALALIIPALIFPGILAWPNRMWMKLGNVLFAIVSPIVLLAMYVSTIVPIGLLLRLFGKDLLRLRLEKEGGSYWIKRSPPGPEPETMRNQF